MSRPRLLDLFCGAGGCSVGYARAGFDVVGVDIEPHADYPFQMFPKDALEVLRTGCVGHDTWLMDFDAIHASPPCQAYMHGGLATGDHPDLLPDVRRLLEATGLPYVIENVPGAPMRADLMLCGSMFGLQVRRHRLFELNVPVPIWTPGCDHSRPVVGVYGHPHGANGAAPGMLPGTVETWSAAMGIDWMNAADLAVAIPPAYTEFIGTLLLEHVKERAA